MKRPALDNPVPPRWRLPLLVAAGSLALYTVAGFLVVPWIIGHQVVRRAQLNLHRQATIQKVRNNPFRFETRLIGFELLDRDSTPLLTFDTMVVNVSAASLLRRALVLDEYRLVRPTATARILENGSLAIADILKPDSATRAAPPSTTHRPPPRVEVRHLSVQQGQVTYVDQAADPDYQEHFTDLGLMVDGLSTLPNEQGDHVLTVSFSGGAQVRWTGTNTIEPLNLQGAFQLTGVRLWKLAEVLGRRHLPMRLTEGTGAATIRYALTQPVGQGLSFRVPAAELHLTGLAVRPPGIEADWLKVPSIDVEGITVEWPERRAAIEKMMIVEPWVSAERLADGNLNWQQYLTRTAADSTPTAPEAPTAPPPWQWSVKVLTLAQGSATITDHVARPAARHDVAGVDVTLSPLGSDSTVPTSIEAAATIDKRATISARGAATRAPFAADLAVKAANLDLRLLSPYLDPGSTVRLVSGVASMDGKVRARATRPRMAFDGSAAITRFALADSAGDSLLTWQAMRVQGIRYTAGPDLARIRKVTLERPFARIAVNKDKTVNLMELSTMMPTDTTKPPFPYEVLEVVIDDGRIDFSDAGLIIPFRTTIDSAQGSIKDVASFGGTPGTLELEGKVEEYGLARANGTLRLDDPYAATNIKADFRNINMVSLTPYSATFAGYSITSGTLDVDMDYVIRDRQLTAGHRIVASNLKLGDKVEGGESPGFLVKLAVSLMKDKEGRIKLDVPVEGTVDDPQFSYKGVVWQAVKQMLGKVATAPFRFLGKLLGIGGDDVELVDFDPGHTDVIPPERQKLDSLAAEMGRKPELVLSIEGRYDSISDARALRALKLEHRISAQRDSMGKKAQADTSTSRLARILERLYTSDHGEQTFDSLRTTFREAARADTTRRGSRRDETAFWTAVREQLEQAEVVGPGELEQLARDRSQAVVAAMTASGTIEAARVTATDPAPVKRKKAGSSRVPSELKLDAR